MNFSHREMVGRSMGTLRVLKVMKKEESLVIPVS